MIIKLIRAEIVPGHRERFLEAQEVWDSECAKSGGYLGQWCGDADSGDAHVLVFWASRNDYERWMGAEHDRIAILAGSEAHYRNLDIRIVEGSDDFPVPVQE